MRTYKTVTRTYDEYDECRCDLCGSQVEPDFGRDQHVEISAKRGTTYPEGFIGERFGYRDESRPYSDPTIDICIECFDKKIIPALRALGLPDTFKWRRWTY